MASKQQTKKDKKILLYGAGAFVLGFFGLMYYLQKKVNAENGATIPATSSATSPNVPSVAPTGTATAVAPTIVTPPITIEQIVAALIPSPISL